MESGGASSPAAARACSVCVFARVCENTGKMCILFFCFACVACFNPSSEVTEGGESGVAWIVVEKHCAKVDQHQNDLSLRKAAIFGQAIHERKYGKTPSN